MTRRLQVIVLALGVTACAAGADGPPHLVEDQTACAHCGMLVSDRRYAAGYIDAGEPTVFDDIACLIAAKRSTLSNPSHPRIWFHDARSAAWLQGPPVFVTSPQLRTPMAGGIVAFGDRAAAAAEAARVSGTVVDSFERLAAAALHGGNQ